MTLDDLLQEWAEWSAADDPRIGYAPKSLGFSVASDEVSEEDGDIALEQVVADRARRVDELIDRLPADERAALHNAYSGRVWRLRDEAGARERALASLTAAVRREGLI